MIDANKLRQFMVKQMGSTAKIKTEKILKKSKKEDAPTIKGFQRKVS